MLIFICIIRFHQIIHSEMPLTDKLVNSYPLPRLLQLIIHVNYNIRPGLVPTKTKIPTWIHIHLHIHAGKFPHLLRSMSSPCNSPIRITSGSHQNRSLSFCMMLFFSSVTVSFSGSLFSIASVFMANWTSPISVFLSDVNDTAS